MNQKKRGASKGQKSAATNSASGRAASANNSSSCQRHAIYVVIIILCVLVALVAVVPMVVPDVWNDAVRDTFRRWAFESHTGLDSERLPNSQSDARGEDTASGVAAVDTLDAPPPLRGASAGPPVPADKTTTKPTSAAPLCYTLEAYSDHFLSRRVRRSATRYFQCGVRVTDLHTTHRSDHREACVGTASADTAYQGLRIVLTEKEAEWHRQLPLNAAAQRIPLNRFNDDYCDCMDGTDELLTNACSMVTGSGMPLVASRWRSHLIAIGDLQLYEDSPPLKDDLNARVVQAYQRQGPVLPIPCVEDPTVLLSPSMVADGLVDCTDGSDESVAAWLPHSVKGTPEARDDAHSRQQLRLAAAEASQRNWHAQRERVASSRAQEWVAPSSVYTTALNPHYTSVRALLVDTGYLSLFTTAEVLAARVGLQESLHTVLAKGHALYKTRVARGWDKMGKVITDKRTEVVMTLANMTHRYDTLRRAVVDEVQRQGVQTPAEARIDPQVLRELEHLEVAKSSVKNDLDYHDIIIQQRLFGDYYEYYPLYAKQLALPYADVADPYRTSPLGQQHRRETGMTAMEALTAQRREMHRLAMEGRDLSSVASEATSVLHVDNITPDLVGIHYGRHLIWRQMYASAEEAEAMARALGLLAPEVPFDPAVFMPGPGESPFHKSPSLVTGHWIPSGVRRNPTQLPLTDPAGDAALPRRLMVRPETPLLRSAGLLQHAYRQVEKDRFLTVRKEDTTDNPTERLRKMQKSAEQAKEEEDKDTVKVPLYYHQNTPNKVAIHLFMGGALRCEASLSEAYKHAPSSADVDAVPTQMTRGAMVAVCDVSDKILSWSMDGRCVQEVVVGTPSACAGWVVEASKERLRQYKAQLAEWQARNGSE